MIFSAEHTRWHYRRLILMTLCVIGLLAARVVIVSAAEVNVAGLIVDYGDGRVSYAWVPFTEDEISGVDLLERSGLDIVTVGFGGMGDAVCQIDDTGCPVGDCRKRLCQTSDPDSPFWRYTRQSEDGEWTFAATGASGAKVRDGDVDAWIWTGKDVDVPAMSINDIAERTGADPASLVDAESAPMSRLKTVGSLELGSDDPSLEQQIAPALVILGVSGLGIWWVRRRRVSST